MHLLLFVAALLAAPVAHAAPAWSEAFADPAAIAREAAEATKDEPTGQLLLWEESRLTYADDGTLRYETRIVTRVQDADAVANAGGFSTSWAPWYEQRPETRMRVVDADGTAHEGDPAALLESAAGATGDTMYADRRYLEGPLPALSPGSVIETWSRVDEHRPFFEAGSITTVGLVQFGPVHHRRIVVDYPASLKLSIVERNVAKGTAKKAKRKGRVIVTWDVAPEADEPEFEGMRPRQASAAPSVSFSTGSSWKGVAAAYSDAVDGVLADADVDALAAEIVGDATERDEVARRLLGWVRDHIRYTGLELGQRAIVPVPPAVTQERGYGDCKDQSTLLVAMLRARGFDAHLALLRVASWYDVDPDVPGLGSFDHAIVHVTGDEPLWIDPTIRLAEPGELSAGSYGRRALVASPTTKALTELPAADPTAHVSAERTDWRLVDESWATIEHRISAAGYVALELRDGHAGASDQERVDWATEYLAQRFGATYTGVESADAEDLATPFAVTMTATGASDAGLWDDEGWLTLGLTSLFQELVESYRTPPQEPRQGPVAAYRPHTVAIDHVLHLPPGWVLAQAPPDLGETHGLVTLTRTTKPIDDRTIAVEARLTLANRDLPAADYEPSAKALQGVYGRAPETWSFRHVVAEAVARGDYSGALEAAALGSEDAPAHRLVREADVFLAAGLRDAARRRAEQATELAPDMPRAWGTLAWVLTHGRLGERFGPGWDRDGAIAAYRRSMKLDPDQPGRQLDLATVLAHNASGTHWGPGAELEAAIVELRPLADQYRDARTLLWMDQWNLGQLDELATALAARTGDVADALAVAVAARKDGVAAAQAEARRRAGTLAGANELLGGAYSDLLAVAEYGRAADLLESLAAGAPAPETRAAIELCRTMAAAQEQRPAPDSPEGLVLDFFQAIFLGGEALTAAIDRMHPALFGEGEDKDPEALVELIESLKVLPASLENLGLSEQFVVDALQAMSDTEVQAFGRGAQVVKMKGPDSTVPALLLREGKELRVVGPIGTDAVAAAVMSPYTRGPLAAGRHGLDAMLSAVQPDAMGMRLRLLHSVVEVGADHSRETIQHAADLLGCDSGAGCVAAIDALAGDDESPLVTITRVLLATTLGDYALAAEAAQRMPEDERPLAEAMSWALAGDVERMHAAMAGRELTPMERVKLAAWSRDVETITKATAELADTEDANLLNELAWQRLMAGVVDDETLGLARRAAQAQGGQNWSTLHTLACIQADRGDVNDALATVARGRQALGDALPGAEVWFILGRIAEHLGAPDDATAIYRRMESMFPDPDSSWHLGQRRLEALGAKATEGP